LKPIVSSFVLISFRMLPHNGMRISRRAGLAPLLRDKPCWQTESNIIKSREKPGRLHALVSRKTALSCTLKQRAGQ
jgi:hypothetical protein